MKIRTSVKVILLVMIVLVAGVISYFVLRRISSQFTIEETLSQIKMMTRYSYPVMYHGDIGQWDDLNVHTFTIIEELDEYRLYYCGQKDSSHENAIGVAFSSKNQPLYGWENYVGNPILNKSDSGWDSGRSGLRMGSIIKLDNGTYYLYYSEDPDPIHGNIGEIGLAISDDGLHFVKYIGNPILSPNLVDEFHVAIPRVIKVGSQFVMYYTVSTTDAGWIPSGYGVATSIDGVSWNEQGIILGLGSGWDSRYMEQCSVLQCSDGIILAYEGYNESKWCIGLAYSYNITAPFIKYENNPILECTNVTDAFDQYHVATPYFYRTQSYFYLLYTGGNNPDYGKAYWSVGMCLYQIR